MGGIAVEVPPPAVAETTKMAEVAVVLKSILHLTEG